MRARMPVAGCCRVEQRAQGPEDTALVVCQACRAQLEPACRVSSLWEYLLEDADFDWPDMGGAEYAVQDCWRDRNHPEVHAAVRGVLQKMNVHIMEINENRERTVFCGDLHMESRDPVLLAALEKQPEKSFRQLPRELQQALMREQLAKFGNSKIVCYCNACERGLRIAGAEPAHLLAMVMGMCS